MSDWIFNNTVIGGSTSKSIRLQIRKTDGTAKTDAAYGDVTAKYLRPGGTMQTISGMSALAAIDSAWSSGGWKHADNGVYRLDVPDAAIAAIAGGGNVLFTIACTGCFPTNFEVGVSASNPSTVEAKVDIVDGVVDALPTSATGYADGAIWVDTNASNTNTIEEVDGTAENPVSTWAAALTLNGLTGLPRFKIAGGSSITLTGSSAGFIFLAESAWTCALNGQEIDLAYFENAQISGTSSGSAKFYKCTFLGSTISPSQFLLCGFNTSAFTKFTATGDGDYIFVDCFSAASASAVPYFTFAASGSGTGVIFRRWSGGANITLNSDCTCAVEVSTGADQTITTGGANVEVRGICGALTLALSGAGTTGFTGITGPITLSGTTTATVNLHGVSSSLTNTTTAATVNDYTVRKAELSAAQADLDILTGTDGVTLATAQTLYAPAKAGDAMALTSGERTSMAAAVWNALTSGMTTVGSIGKKLADWVVDLWASEVPGDYADGTAGAALGQLNNVPADLPVTVLPAPSADPELCVVYFDSGLGSGTPVSGLTIQVLLVSPQPAVSITGRIVSAAELTMTEDPDTAGRYLISLERKLVWKLVEENYFGSGGKDIDIQADDDLIDVATV